MTQLLDTINQALEEIEEQLLAEFHRVRNTISEHRFEKIDTGIKVALESVVDDLQGRLEGTAEHQELQLQTEHHENLFVRMVVLKQLLQANISTAYLQEAHDDLEDSRRTLENRVLTNRTLAPPSQLDPDLESRDEQTGFFGSLRGLFNRKPGNNEADRNHIRVTEREANAIDDPKVYQDNGIYSASRELAMLANLVNTGSTQPTQSLAGKATFDSRNLSDTNTRSGQKLAQTPEEIRAKLAGSESGHGGTSSFEAKDPGQKVAASRRYTHQDQSQHQNEPKAASAEEIRQKLAQRSEKSGASANNITKGASVFESRNLTHSAPEVPLKERIISKPVPKPAPRKEKVITDKSDLAQSPEAIRAKLEARKNEPATVTGKASFQSKDVDHLQPQEYVSRKPEKPASTEPEQPTGKAIFESKELSTQPPKR